jgi:hypothetical protein
VIVLKILRPTRPQMSAPIGPDMVAIPMADEMTAELVSTDFTNAEVANSGVSDFHEGSHV